MTTPLSDSETIVKLGHNEGWVVLDPTNARRPVIFYSFGYAFIVLAHLTDGSDPNSCPEGQFVGQYTLTKMFYDPTTGKLSPIKETKEIPRFMYSQTGILKTERIGDLETDGKLADSDILEESRLHTEKLDRGCSVQSNVWCGDDYVHERGGPGNKYKEWTYFMKKHKKNTLPPKILWFDNPGAIVHLNYILDGEGRGYPWTRNTRSIFIDRVKSIQFSFISIVEDFGSDHRFYCKMDNLVMENDPNKATNNQKMQVTEPTCKCVEQEWRGGQWEDKGEPKECGLGPKSFIQSV